MKIHVFRLHPGQDLKIELRNYVNIHKIKAGVILTAVGGLSKLTIRMAGAKPDNQQIKSYDKDFELVSLSGTISVSDIHLHIACSDQTGKTIGGHLKEGCIIDPTMEIAIGELEDVIFTTKFDAKTGFNELVIKNKV